MFLFSMSKLDIRNYLQGIYKVDVYKVNTRIQHGEQSWKIIFPCKVILDSLGFWIQCCGFQIPSTVLWIHCQ